jgi:hypothetical protein
MATSLPACSRDLFQYSLSDASKVYFLILNNCGSFPFSEPPRRVTKVTNEMFTVTGGDEHEADFSSQSAVVRVSQKFF